MRNPGFFRQSRDDLPDSGKLSKKCAGTLDKSAFRCYFIEEDNFNLNRKAAT